MDKHKDKSKPRPIDPEAPTLDVEGAARLLALRPSTVRKYVMVGEPPYYKIGARVCFDRDELPAYRNRHRVAPVGSAA